MKIVNTLLLFLIPVLLFSNEPIALSIEEHGFSGLWSPVEKADAPILIVLGGSEGGVGFGRDIASPWLNSAGFHVLTVVYFRAEGLPDQLEEIPLEYLDKAISWLDNKKGKQTEKMGLLGVSKGAEKALLQASRIDRFGAIALVSPSSVIWQSINQRDFTSVKSSWTLGGEALPFMPYCYDKGFVNVFNLYNCALDDPESMESFIKAENINAPILLLSGGDDKLWPSERMANMLIERLEAKDFSNEVIHLNYPKAGHWLLAPHIQGNANHPQLQNQQMFDFLGGSVENLLEIAPEVELAVIEFFKGNLEW
ncbi:MAG: hypothetical protein EA362_05095 [Saprospirales bacterium]|nr:MAG: hypothetical protein EA362_05095 [Saprospirales bacterium]